jgi:hypothetical protein
LYVWQAQSLRIALEHFSAAQAVIETSHRFVTELLEERARSFEPTKVQEVEAAMEQRVIAKLKRNPGITRRDFSRQMSKDKGGYSAWVKTLDALLKAEAIFTEKKGQREELFAYPGCWAWLHVTAYLPADHLISFPPAAPPNTSGHHCSLP